MKKYTINQLWAFINRIEVDSPVKTRERAAQAEAVLCKCDYLDVNIFDEMMNSIAYIVRESYHR